MTNLIFTNNETDTVFVSFKLAPSRKSTNELSKYLKHLKGMYEVSD